MPNPHFVTDPAYQKKVLDLLMETLMKGLMTPDGKAVIWRSGDIAEAMLGFQAMVLADSFSSPTQAREFSTDYGKRLFRRISQFRAHNAQHGPVMQHVTVEGDMQ
jgi:hypothetical protein